MSTARRLINVENPRKREFSRVYSSNKTIVCRPMFIKTLGISTKRVNTALRKMRNLSVPDKRGVVGGHNKTSKKQRVTMINHINKFPRYISHYCRATRNNKEFLPIEMTVTLMHKLYTEENSTHVSLSAYRKIFYKEFNLKTKIPKKDTCNKCDSYQAKIQKITSNNKEKQNVSSEHYRHLEEAELARKQMNSDL
ncbi:hypothetical protein ILUMI_18999 [Ignelater luminosus]|uniref:Uncharacterized protein n=1 Tax=Ignelater luminosus TaxID=2038154 RepID=A0A8K0G5V5_IGNLU|nr:hypothetical protein ILUMI_18999 [Ignelater luminosus]